MTKIKSERKADRKPIRTYKRKIKYACPTRGEVEEEVDVKVYAAATPQEESRYESLELKELLRQEGVIEDEN